MSATIAHRETTAGDAFEYYTRHGYVVCDRLISSDAIAALMRLYRRDILPSDQKFFRQNTNHYEPNRMNAYGFVSQCFLDIHAYRSFPEFQEAALQVYFSSAITQALTQITGSATHNLMQSMLFDLNTETPPHQDWWYLDSAPNGRLIAAWIALEDIAEEAGRFFVVPGSQEVRLHEADLPHSEWLERIKRYVDEHRTEIHAPAMKKGDVMFWNSRTIHGSLPTGDERYSRKSLTAHYLPSELTFGNLFVEKPWVRYQNWNGHDYFANQPEYSLKADLSSRAKQALYDNPRLLKIARKFQKKSIADLS